MTIASDDSSRGRGERFRYNAALSAVFFLFVACSNERSEDKKPAVSTTEQGAAKVVPHQAPREGVQSKESLVTEEKVQEFVQTWVRAQNAGAFADYEKLYAERMQGTKRVDSREAVFDRKGWLEDRKTMFAGPFTVEMRDLKVSLAGGVAVARFQQAWENPRFRDVGPKQLVIAMAGDQLRISREEMLSSEVGEKKTVGALDPRDIALVRVSGGEIRLLLPKKPELKWISGRPQMSPGGAAICAVDTKLMPESERVLLDQKFELFDQDGMRCEAKPEAFQVLIDVVPHFGVVHQWKGGDESAPPVPLEKRALDLWEMSSERGKFLTLKLAPVSGQAAANGCKNPVWGRMVREGSQVWAVRDATPLEAEELGAVAQKQPDYLSQFKNSGQSPNVKMVQSVRMFEHSDGRKYAVAELVAPGERCGQSELLPYWVILRGAGKSAQVVSNGDVGNAELPLSAVAVPGLSEPVFVSSHYVFRQGGSGLFNRTLDQRAENFDCSC